MNTNDENQGPGNCSIALEVTRSDQKGVLNGQIHCEPIETIELPETMPTSLNSVRVVVYDDVSQEQALECICSIGGCINVSFEMIKAAPPFFKPEMILEAVPRNIEEILTREWPRQIRV